MGKTTTITTNTSSTTVTQEGISDSAHKQWMTKKNNKIEELEDQLDNSVSAAAHQQWMTKKNNEIAEKDAEIAKLKAELASKK